MTSPPLRVLVDASNFKPVMTGLRTYTLGLVEAIAHEPTLDIAVATSMPDEFGHIAKCRVVSIPAATRDPVKRAIWRETSFPRLARGLGAEVLLGPGHEIPLRRLHIPSALVIHDVGPVDMPHLYGGSQTRRHRVALRLLCSRADAIVCVSDATRSALTRVARVDTRKCYVIGEGPQVCAEPRDPDSVEPYILYVGSLFRHKNVAPLARAFSSPSLDGLRLRLVGPVRENERSFLASLVSEGHGRVSHEGFVSAENLKDLYSKATAVALPSLYEGYGLPVVEALCAGRAVISTDLPSVREIADEAALYVAEPTSPAAWVAAVGTLRDEALREQLERVARKRAPMFSWASVGARFAELLTTLGSRG